MKDILGLHTVFVNIKETACLTSTAWSDLGVNGILGQNSLSSFSHLSLNTLEDPWQSFPCFQAKNISRYSVV